MNCVTFGSFDTRASSNPTSASAPTSGSMPYQISSGIIGSSLSSPR